MILFCACPHLYQDQKYGAQQRVHNERKKDGELKGYRCPVCGKEKAK